MRVTAVEGRRVTVMGLGRFGGQIEVARYLATHGAHVTVTDTSPADSLADSVAQLDGLGIRFVLGEHREEDFVSADVVVPSPAVPPNNPYLQLSAARHIPIVIEIELMLERLLAQSPDQPLVGVTGTKGKSTTTALLGRMLATRFTTHIGGNIGRPLINRLADIRPTDVVLLELSSYMLHYLGQRNFRPRVALVTLVSEDHLDWHGGLTGYLAAKQNLVRHQLPTDHAVLYRGSPSAPDFARLTRASVHFYDRDTLASAGTIPLVLPGEHNQLNAQGARLAATLMGVSPDAAAAAVADFPGLPHRLELVHESAGVRYYNDSIATIPEAAVAALNAFDPGKVIQIVGGYDKHLDTAPLAAALARSAKAALCIGTLGPALAAQIGPKARLVHTLDAAVAEARSLARQGDVVLLSPGTASYDQFPNFQARGDRFKALVTSAPPATP